MIVPEELPKETRKGSKPTGSRTVSPARLAAFEILNRVERDGAFSSILLNDENLNLSQADHALCHELVLGVLRWQLWLDALIEHYSSRKIDSLDLGVRLALRIGLYQLRFLTRVPASAAVNEAVNLAYVSRLRSASGFINAVLRHAIRELDFDPAAGVQDKVQLLSIKSSHPEWLVDRWIRQFGIDETRLFAVSNNQQAPTTIRTASPTSNVNVQELLQGESTTQSRITPGAWKLEGGVARLRKLAAQGKIYIQDESSQLVAHLLDPKPYDRVFDACAAPGSKTTLIAALTGDRAFVIAGDFHEKRVKQTLELARRQRLKGIRGVVLNAADAPFRESSFDRVLVDAPCSGTGTLRRNPEIRWRITNSDISTLAAKQLSILKGAARTVKIGGRLVYSTCSVEEEENEGVIRRFLSTNSNYRLDLPSICPELVSKEGIVRIWPHKDGADGFFAAVLMRLR